MFLLFLCSMSASAQDVIVKRDGTAVVCRIINVSSLEIVYKKWTDLQGPNLVLSVADAASITYENGEKKTFDIPAKQEKTEVITSVPQIQNNNHGTQVVSDDELLKMARKPELTKEQKKIRRLKHTGWVTGGLLVAGGAIWGLVVISGEENGGYYGAIAAGACLMAGGIATTSACLIRAHNLTKKTSSNSVHSAPLYHQDFHLKNGTSLSAGVNMLKDNTLHDPTLGLGLSYNF